MRIRIEDLPEEGLEVEIASSQAWVARAAEEGLEGGFDGASGHLLVRRVGPGVHVGGEARARVLRECDRCLAPIRLSFGGDVDLYYDAGPVPGQERSGLSAEDLDTGFLEGEEVDLSEVLTEFLALEVPPRVCCGDPGVERLDEGACEVGVPLASGKAGDLRFALLERLKSGK
jgi:uncharacterized metal-binding protein YceD (DUF177 family)